MSTPTMQVYNVRQAKQDIDAVYSMGLFDDVNILPQPSEDSTLEQPKVHPAGLCQGLWQLPPPQAVTAAGAQQLHVSSLHCRLSARLAAT